MKKAILLATTMVAASIGATFAQDLTVGAHR